MEKFDQSSVGHEIRFYRDDIPEELQNMAGDIDKYAKDMARDQADNPRQLTLATELVCSELMDIINFHKSLGSLATKVKQ